MLAEIGQTVGVAIVVGGAVVFLVLRLWQAATGKGGGGCSSMGSCGTLDRARRDDASRRGGNRTFIPTESLEALARRHRRARADQRSGRES